MGAFEGDNEKQMLRMPLDLSFHAVIFYSVFEGDTCTGEEDD